MSHFRPESFGAGSQGNFNSTFDSPGQSQMGGGFIDSPGTASPGFSQATQRRKDTQSLLPVTVKQLNDASPSDNNPADTRLKIDGKEIAQITLVGIILHVKVQPTNVEYMIADGTGTIDVKVYIDSDDENNARHKQWREHTYVRVIGNYRSFRGSFNVIGFTLIPITDFNEITFHMLQVISCHLKNTKAAAAGLSQGSFNPTGGRNLNFSSPMQPVGGNNAFNQSNSIQGSHSQFNNGNNNPMYQDFSPVQKEVMMIFNADKTDTGVHLEEVYNKLQHINRKDIHKAIETMSEEGHLYSTIDENHFKSTDSDM